MMKRRSFLSSALASGIIGGLCPMVVRGVAWAQSKDLRGMHYGGPYAAFDEIIAKPFAASGIGTISYSADTTPGAYAKLEADPTNPPYDVFMSIRSLSVRFSGSGLLAKIDRNLAPNINDLDSGAVVPGDFGAALVIEYPSLMYNKAKVNQPPVSWLDLWRPEYAGRIALHASTTVTPLYLIAVYTRAIGSNEKDEKAVEEAFAKYKELKKSVRVFTTDPVQVNMMMDREEVDIGVQFGIRISALMAQNPNIARAVPKEGVPAIPLDLVIPANTPNLELAHKYLNFALSPEIQSSIARKLVATPSNPKTSFDAETKQKILSDYSKLIYLDEGYLGSVREPWLARWQKEVQS